MEDLSRFCCQNAQCQEHGKRNADNLYVRDRYGKDNSLRLLCCRRCGARFSENRGTPLFSSKLPRDKVLSVLEHLAEGCGVRQTARLIRVDRKTVGRLACRAGGHAKALHDELVAFSPSDAGSADGREVVVRHQKAGKLQRRRPGRR